MAVLSLSAVGAPGPRAVPRPRLRQAPPPLAGLLDSLNDLGSWARTVAGGARMPSSHRAGLVRRLLAACRRTDRGASASRQDRDAIAALVADLEAVNPTAAPALSGDLLGTWALVYTAPETPSRGFNAPGAVEGRYLAPLRSLAGRLRLGRAGRVAQVFTPPRGGGNVGLGLGLANELEFVAFGRPGVLTVSGDCVPPEPGDDPGVRTRVAFTSVRLAWGGGLDVTLPLPGGLARGWLETTYLDRELRIGRGSKGGLFVTTRRPG